MNALDIAFPNLGIYLENIPRGFEIFGFYIAFYGLIIGIGILAGILLVERVAIKTGQNADTYWDFALYAVVFSVIGARLYYVAFSWDKYKDDLLSIFNTRNGGMAIYGAVIGAFLTLFVYTRIKKLNAFQIGDTGVLGLILGQVIGRWGNFMNREAFGEYTDNLFAMRLPIEAVRSHEITEEMWAHVTDGVNYIQVHPTFLYESAWNLLVLIFLLWYFKRKKFHGEICLFYLGGYGLGRFFIEALRTDQLWIPGTEIPVSQVLALCMFTFAVVADIMVRILIKKGKVAEYRYIPASKEAVEETNAEISEASEMGTEPAETEKK